MRHIWTAWQRGFRGTVCLALCWAFCLAPAGCTSKAGADRAMDRYIDSLQALLAQLEDIQDEASYMAARPRLKELLEESDKLHLRFGTDFSLADVSPAQVARSEAIEESITRQFERLSGTHPEVAHQIMLMNRRIQDKVFMELE